MLSLTTNEPQDKMPTSPKIEPFSRKDNLKIMDALYTELLELTSMYQQLTETASHTISIGFLHLGKSKYIMGCDAISQHSYHLGPMSPQTICRVSPQKDVNGACLFSTKMNDDEKVVDVLNWFGKLVPGSLKSAQANFRLSLEMLVKVVQTRHQIDVVMLKIQNLKGVVKEQEDAMISMPKVLSSASLQL